MVLWWYCDVEHRPKIRPWLIQVFIYNALADTLTITGRAKRVGESTDIDMCVLVHCSTEYCQT